MGGALPPLRDRLLVDAIALGECSQARLTMLYRSTDRRRRCGAPMVNLAHSASRRSCEKSAPSNPGIKHLVHPREVGDVLRLPGQLQDEQAGVGPVDRVDVAAVIDFGVVDLDGDLAIGV